MQDCDAKSLEVASFFGFENLSDSLGFISWHSDSICFIRCHNEVGIISFLCGIISANAKMDTFLGRLAL